MTRETFTFHTDPALGTAFVAMAESRRLAVADVLRGLMRGAVADHREAAALDRWQRREIAKAVAEADAVQDRAMPDAVADEHWRRRKAAIGGDHG